jgi:hypothetical protein
MEGAAPSRPRIPPGVGSEGSPTKREFVPTVVLCLALVALTTLAAATASTQAGSIEIGAIGRSGVTPGHQAAVTP